MTPGRITVGDIIAEHGRSYPGQLALADGEVELTWPEFDERVNRLANALRGTGVGPGDRILWLGQNSFRVYELLGAAARIGAMVCPGYWRWAPPEMAFAIEDFSPAVVIWQEEEIGSTVRTARALASPAAETALWLRHDGDPRHGYEAFLAGGDPADPGLDIDPDSALLVIYTAAISGRQGGSMLSHANLIAMGMSVAWLGDIDDRTVFLNSGPMFHIGNFQFFGIPVLIQGGTNVVTRRVVAAEVLDILAARPVHPRLPHAGHDRPAGRADAGARDGTAAAEGHHRSPAVAGPGGRGRQPPRPRRRRHGLRLRADRGHRLLPVRRVRRAGCGQRGPSRAGHRGPDPRRGRPGMPGRRRPARSASAAHRAPGLLEPAGDQRAAVPRRLVAHHRPGPARSRTARSPSSAR